jgi:hypothetical protein
MDGPAYEEAFDTLTRKTILEVAVFIFLSAVAIAGWARRPEPTNAGITSPSPAELAAENRPYGNDEFSGAAVEDSGSTDIVLTSSEPAINRAQSGATPCGASAKRPVYNDSYYTGPYSSSNRPVRVSTVTRQNDESYAPAQPSYPERTPKRRRTAKHSLPMGGRTAALAPTNRDLASEGTRAGIRTGTSATAAFVYERLSYKKPSGL